MIIRFVNALLFLHWMSAATTGVPDDRLDLMISRLVHQLL